MKRDGWRKIANNFSQHSRQMWGITESGTVKEAEFESDA
jgi:hypothetical protein